MKNALVFFAAILAAFHLQAQSTNPFNETKWYRLTTQFQGEGKSLDVINDGKNDKLTLAKTGNFSGQSWRFTPIGNGWYRLTCQFQGDGKSLDVINDGKNDKLTLAKTGNFSGQYWKFTPLGNGWHRVTCQFQGDGKSLDVINDGKNDKLTLAKTGNFSGQYWKITELPGVAFRSGAICTGTVHNLNRPGSPVFKSCQITNNDLIESGQYAPTATQFPSMPAGGTYNIFILTQKDNAQAFLNWKAASTEWEKKIKNFARTLITIGTVKPGTLEVGDQFDVVEQSGNLAFNVYRGNSIVASFSCKPKL